MTTIRITDDGAYTTNPTDDLIKVSSNRFNELVLELSSRLKFCYQDSDGTIHWYEGTRKRLFELVQYATGAWILWEGDSSQKSQTP